MNRVLRLFTWQTIELLTIGILFGTSFFTLWKTIKQGQDLNEINNEKHDIQLSNAATAKEISTSILILEERYTKLMLQSRTNDAITNETKYILKNLKRSLNNCKCFTEIQKNEEASPHHNKKHKPQPIG